MNRRTFATLLGSALLARPPAARAQQPATPVIGFLGVGAPAPMAVALAKFRQGLQQSGYVEGRNLNVEYRWANSQLPRLRPMAADLVRRQVAAIVAVQGFGAINAAMAATATIPIVIASGSDPVKSGFVASLNRPGGNVTGATDFMLELAAKRLELLSKLVPAASTIAYLGQSGLSLSEEQKTEVLAAAAALGHEIVLPEFWGERDFESAFATILERGAKALMVGAFPIFTRYRDRLVALAASSKIPAIYPIGAFVFRGGLMSYSGDPLEMYYNLGTYVGRILKGANPADLPIMQPTKFRLLLNLRTARALDLTIPATLRALADEVIE